jgi:hypothetical protein
MVAKQLPGSIAPDQSQYVTLTDGNGNIVTPGGGTSGLVVGTTTVTGATNGYVLYNNAGLLGAQAGGGAGSLIVGTSPITGGTANYVLSVNSAGTTLANIAVRPILTANITLYVNNTTGNDSNPGTVGSPFATLNHAWNTACIYDLGENQITIQMADSATPYDSLQVYPANTAFGGTTTFVPLNGQIVIQGNLADQTQVTIGCSYVGGSYSCISLIGSWNTTVVVRSLTLSTVGVPGSGNANLYVTEFNNTSYINNVTLYNAQAGVTTFGLFAYYSSQINCYQTTGTDNITFSGYINNFAQAAINATCSIYQANFIMVGPNITLNAFAGGFYAADSSRIYATLGTIIGSATGPRFLADSISLIQTYGAGNTYLPGTLPGIVQNGAQYL